MSLNLATTGGTAGGFDHLGPGPHDLVVDLHAPAGWAVIGGTAGTPWSLASQTTSKLTYQALGVHAEDVYGCEFEVELTDNSYGWAYGYAVVTDVDLDLPDGADDDTESTVPHPLPITIPGDTFPAGDPALLGHQPATSLWYGIDAPTAYTTVPGQLEFHVFGPGVALYRLNGSTYEYEPLTAPITASHVGDISEEIVVYTNDLFTGEATIEARLSHDNGPTDSADVVKIVPDGNGSPGSQGGGGTLFIEVYSPKVFENGDQLVPNEDAQTFVNLDNDDADSLFDDEDDEVEDDEFIRLRLKVDEDAILPSGIVRLNGVLGSSDVRVWSASNRTQEYALGDAMSFPDDFWFEDGYYVRDMWVEAVEGHSQPRSTALAFVSDDELGEEAPEVQITCLDVEIVKWIGRGNAADGGDDLGEEDVRVFPGARAPAFDTPRRKVTLRVRLSPHRPPT